MLTADDLRDQWLGESVLECDDDAVLGKIGLQIRYDLFVVKLLCH